MSLDESDFDLFVDIHKTLIRAADALETIAAAQPAPWAAHEIKP